MFSLAEYPALLFYVTTLHRKVTSPVLLRSRCPAESNLMAGIRHPAIQALPDYHRENLRLNAKRSESLEASWLTTVYWEPAIFDCYGCEEKYQSV